MSPAEFQGILATLHEEHESVKETFTKMEGTGSRAAATRARLLQELRELLVPHMAGEERAFYAEVRKAAADDEQRATVLEGYEEHTHAKSALRRLEKADPASPEWDARLKVLKELVTHHIEDEESQLFELATEALGAEGLAAVAERYRTRQQAALAALG